MATAKLAGSEIGTRKPAVNQIHSTPDTVAMVGELFPPLGVYNRGVLKGGGKEGKYFTSYLGKIPSPASSSPFFRNGKQ